MFYFTKFLVLMSILCVVSIAARYQELVPKPGFVPVYIREGNTPLSQINPKLVEAFGEGDALNQSSKEAETAREIEESKYGKINQGTENTKKEDRTLKVQANRNGTEQDRSDVEKEKQEQELPPSDIAEFTSDDIKTLADD